MNAEPDGKEKEILELIPQENSWEQILNQVVALNNLDPWNLDLNKLSSGFSDYVSSLEDLNFRIPAKWVIIAAVLLRMKSDYIKIMKLDEEPEENEFDEIEDFDEIEMERPEAGIEIDPMEASSKRKPVRRATLNELLDSLKRVLKANERRESRMESRRKKINLTGQDITKRIEGLYDRINSMLRKVNGEELSFRKLVRKWERDHVIDTFLPMMHLDQEKKIMCTQEKMFEDILIKRRGDAS